jgi:hypothetical protein
MPTPTVEPSSSTAVIVNWTEPSDAEARGDIGQKSYAPDKWRGRIMNRRRRIGVKQYVPLQ